MTFLRRSKPAVAFCSERKRQEENTMAMLNVNTLPHSILIVKYS